MRTHTARAFYAVSMISLFAFFGAFNSSLGIQFEDGAKAIYFFGEDRDFHTVVTSLFFITTLAFLTAMLVFPEDVYRERYNLHVYVPITITCLGWVVFSFSTEEAKGMHQFIMYGFIGAAVFWGLLMYFARGIRWCFKDGVFK